jgi:hypothetical protein
MNRQILTAYQEWALDNGFEYIEVVTGGSSSSCCCSSSSSSSSSRIVAGYNDREKYGLPRLMEALQSNMWSTMQRKALSHNTITTSSSNSSSSSSSSISSCSSVFHTVDQHQYHHVSGSISSGTISRNTEEVSNNIYQYQQGMDDDNVVYASTITTDDNINQVNHSSCSGNRSNRIDGNRDDLDEAVDMYHESINGQRSNSNDNLREAQAININNDNREIACDDGDEEFAQLNVFSDFISQVCNVFYVNVFICAYIYL